MGEMVVGEMEEPSFIKLLDWGLLPCPMRTSNIFLFLSTACCLNCLLVYEWCFFKITIICHASILFRISIIDRRVSIVDRVGIAALRVTLPSVSDRESIDKEGGRSPPRKASR